MLSMTQSTESKEKKEIWRKQVHAQGRGPQGDPLPRVGPLLHGHSRLAGTGRGPSGVPALLH